MTQIYGQFGIQAMVFYKLYVTFLKTYLPKTVPHRVTHGWGNVSNGCNHPILHIWLLVTHEWSYVNSVGQSSYPMWLLVTHEWSNVNNEEQPPYPVWLLIME